MFCIHNPKHNGPNATPKNLIIEYKEKIVPLSLFGTIEARAAFAAGSSIPNPLEKITNELTNNIK